MTILPLSYLPSVEYVARLLREQCVIDVGEHYVKRSERNRAYILSANKVMPLTVNVVGGNRPRLPMRDVEIDYSKRWQHQHWVSILSAYKSSPYFDHYASRLQRFYEEEWSSLVEFNLAILSELCAIAGIPMPEISRSYVEAREGDVDLRPKQNGSAFYTEPYVQVFADRQPFVGNLSFIDLLFAEGPAAVAVLKRCRPVW